MKKQKLGAALGVVFVGAFLGVSIFYSLPSNVLATRQGEISRVISLSFAPQSWAFFTKDPVEEEFHILKRENKNWESLSRFPQSEAQNLFGLSRDQRSQGVEFAIIANEVSEWRECIEYEWEECLDEATLQAPEYIVNPSTNPTICGDVILLITEPVPWSYRELVDKEREILKFSRGVYECL
ncbi:SdpA family antimicrobial peptide system protein [Timonella sp. A28]|uniref:SdpA family antimicrobial peptide system protein n=1 Tax=Timonella sp. A28 TaxID=3442640 RepID=UPI003EBF86A7